MVKQSPEEKITEIVGDSIISEKLRKKSSRLAYTFGIIGVIITLAMAAAIIYFNDEVKELQQYGYLGAFLISIPAGATVIVPVPAIWIIFALGSVVPFPWLVGLCAAVGETVGALSIYMTGHGAGRAISSSKHSKVQRIYERMLGLIERRGAITLFAVTSVVNPFFYPAAFACGALKFGLRKYTIIVLIGKTIKSMTVVYAGYFGLKGLFHLIGIDL